eukprot:2097563-Pyramimonas_sp.AAC.1
MQRSFPGFTAASVEFAANVCTHVHVVPGICSNARTSATVDSYGTDGGMLRTFPVQIRWNLKVLIDSYIDSDGFPW